MKKILMVHEVASQAELLWTSIKKYYGDTYEVKRIIYFDHKYYKKSNNILKVWLSINDVQKSFLSKIVAWFKILKFLIKNFNIIKESDIIHFFSGSSFLPKNLDIPILKRIFNVKIIMEYNWSEIRMPKYSESVNPYYKLSEGCNYFSDKQVKKHLKKIQKHLDLIIIPYYELYWNIQWVVVSDKIKILPHIIEKNYIIEWSNDNLCNNWNKFKILHAPSNKNTKWSFYINKCINLLQKKYNFIEYTEITNKSRKEVLSLIKDTDIVIDQMLIWDYGIFAIEAMSFWKPTICYLLDSVIKKYPSNLSIVNTDLIWLYHTIEELILDKNNLSKIWKDSLNFIKSYHLENTVIKKYKELLDSLY